MILIQMWAVATGVLGVCFLLLVLAQSLPRLTSPRRAGRGVDDVVEPCGGALDEAVASISGAASPGDRRTTSPVAA